MERTGKTATAPLPFGDVNGLADNSVPLSSTIGRERPGGVIRSKIRISFFRSFLRLIVPRDLTLQALARESPETANAPVSNLFGSHRVRLPLQNEGLVVHEMRFELIAVSFLDRWMIGMRYFAVLVLFLTVALVLQLAFMGLPSEASIWVCSFSFIALVCLFTYDARGPTDSGYLEINPAQMSVEHNGSSQVIEVNAVTGATLFNVFGNKMIVLIVGNEKHQCTYSQYAAGAEAAFRQALGTKLDRGNVIGSIKHLMADRRAG